MKKEKKKKGESRNVASLPLLPLLVDSLKNYYFVTLLWLRRSKLQTEALLPGFFSLFLPSLSFLYKIRLQLPSGNLIIIMIIINN